MALKVVAPAGLAKVSQEWLEALGGTAGPLAGLGEGLKCPVGGALEGQTLDREQAYGLACCTPEELPALCRAASIVRDKGKGRVVTFSPKVFIPLTRLCRDFCGYCTFRQSPAEAQELYMSVEAVLQVARAGEHLGCTEALFTLGERPELRYQEARDWLRAMGHSTTIQYLQAVCKAVVEETGLLPHANPGNMTRRELISLKAVSASVGIMLESASERLCGPGGPHELAPSKRPRARLKTMEVAGELKVPFTTGILVGIGETREERIEALLSIRQLHQRYGHIQEVIIQNFRAKPGTAMATCPDTSLIELLWTVAVARLVLGAGANVQAPPNLSNNDYPLLLLAGINDWGGVSPLTIDYVNPEAPWPQLEELRRETEKMGFQLKPRLSVYPEYILGDGAYMTPDVRSKTVSMADGDGYVKGGIERYAPTRH